VTARAEDREVRIENGAERMVRREWRRVSAVAPGLGQIVLQALPFGIGESLA